MLTTRCPSCNTVFRIRAEQLNQRGGRVRCGNCHNAFLALSTLEELPDDTDLKQSSTSRMPPAPPRPITPTLPTSTPAPTPTGVAAAPAAPAPAPTPSAATAPAVPAPAAAPSAAAAAAIKLVEAPAAAIAKLAESAQSASASQDAKADSTQPAAAEPTAKAGDETPEADFQFDSSALDFEIPLDDEGTSNEADSLIISAGLHTEPAGKHDEANHERIEIVGLEPEEDEALPPAAVADAGSRPSIVLHGDGSLVSVIEQMSDESNVPRRETVEPATVFLDEEIILPEKPQRGAALWWSGAALLALLAIAQGAYIWRTELTILEPSLRPPMSALCQHLGCELPYPANAEQISVEATDLNPDTSRAGHFTLVVTLRNRARFAQSWPHLELTLTDRFDRAISRRVLPPPEWLPTGSNQSPAFSPLGEVTAQVSFSSELPAAGYRLYAFYP